MQKAQIIDSYSMQAYDRDLELLYQQLPDAEQRLQTISGYFLGKPYLFGALGEGPEAKFDKSPLYRTDKFDCLTYVSTVLALFNSDDLADFKKSILVIRYAGAAPQYVKRNHFTSLDWNTNNQANGYIENITNNIVDEQGKPIAIRKKTHIDKKNWYRRKRAVSLKQFQSLTEQQSKGLLKELRALSKQVANQRLNVSYIPLKALFDRENKPRVPVFEQIPSGVIVELVWPNKDLTRQIGTSLNVTHLGFALKDNKNLIFRHASVDSGTIIDIPLTDYLHKFIRSPTIKGISLHKIIVHQRGE